MKGLSDQQLLVNYASRGDEGAFAELVRRQVDLVYSAARRLIVDPHLAEDVTQAVFTALARQALSVAHRLDGGAPLSGWLHVTTRNHAAATVRSEERRRAREQEAAMEEPSNSEPLANWERIAPQLDPAMAELSDSDRDALLLRFFERRTAKEIGDRLGVGEEAAQKRVNRALERLRGVFVARGLAVPSATLAGALTLNAVQTAPAALAGTVATGVVTAANTTISAFGILKIMASTKLKLTVAILVATGLAITVDLQRRANQRLREELATAKASPIAPPEPVAINAVQLGETSVDLLRLRADVAQLREKLKEANANERPAASPVEPPTTSDVSTEDQVAPGYYASKSWADMGVSSPLNSAVTFLWSLQQGDARAYTAVMGKTNLLQVPVVWASAVQQVKGSELFDTQTTERGQQVSIRHEMSDGSSADTFITFVDSGRGWKVRALAGFPIQLHASELKQP